MDEDVAKARGLKAFNSLLPSLKYTESPQLSPVTAYRTTVDLGIGTRHYQRRAKVAEEDRQVAEISISHDGEYAIATCIALDKAADDKEEKPIILDDGSGEPIHEPEWGDLGWIGPTDQQARQVAEESGTKGEASVSADGKIMA